MVNSIFLGKGGTLGDAQGLLLVLLKGLYGMSRIKLRSPMCKAKALSTVLIFQPFCLVN